jgi:hypothetical protein
MDYVQILSAAGVGGIVGSLLTTLIQSWLSNKQHLNNRSFQEKKEAYIGLIDSFRAATNVGKDIDGQFAYWSTRCSLVGTQEIIKHIQEMKTDDYDTQEVAFKKLEQAMRKDLGVEN